jgi:hypothetical protein
MFVRLTWDVRRNIANLSKRRPARQFLRADPETLQAKRKRRSKRQALAATGSLKRGAWRSVRQKIRKRAA